MRELREETFSGNKDEDTHDHIDRFLSIVGLFNIPRVLKDAVMLQVFPFTLIGAAKRYCPPSMTAKQLEDIHNFKQDRDESLYQAWEWYNGLLYMCPTHDINSHQKGPIHGMTPTQALTKIQTMSDHSQKWHDGTTSRNIRSSSSNDRLAALVNNKRRAFWSLNEDILKITVLKTNTPYPSRKIRRIRAYTHQRPQKE
ncbi:hypothetical protein Tco_0919494 [Tanacetum coccineum]